jgi:hypothetical protein
MKIGDLVYVRSAHIPSRRQSVSVIVGFDQQEDPVLCPLIPASKVFAGDPTPCAFFREDVYDYESYFCSKG